MQEQSPVFDANDQTFDPNKVISALRREQCAQVKNAMPRALLRDAAHRTEIVFESYDGKADAQFNDKYKVANISMIDPDPDNLSYPMVRSIRLSPLWDVITSYLESRSIYCLVPITYTRKVSPTRPDIAIPFHQDGLGVPDEPEFSMLSLWILLSPDVCGPSKAPGLEFLISDVNRKLAFEEKGSELFRNAETASIEIRKLEEAGARRWAPQIEVGDAMMFSRFNPHRAFLEPEHLTSRFSFETRLMAVNNATTELLAKRNTWTIEMSDTRTIGPKRIDWSTMTVVNGAMDWHQIAMPAV